MSAALFKQIRELTEAIAELRRAVAELKIQESGRRQSVASAVSFTDKRGPGRPRKVAQ